MNYALNPIEFESEIVESVLGAIRAIVPQADFAPVQAGDGVTCAVSSEVTGTPTSSRLVAVQVVVTVAIAAGVDGVDRAAFDDLVTSILVAVSALCPDAPWNTVSSDLGTAATHRTRVFQFSVGGIASPGFASN